MKKVIAQKSELSKFSASKISQLSTIAGGSDVDPEKTTTSGYETHSSATDSDSGDHDNDA